MDAVVADPFFGDTVRVGSLTTAPALTPDGLVVTPNEHGDDLLAWRQEEDRAVLAWSAHPGGTIATVAAVGDLVVAATQDRAVRAYDERGRRLWSWTGDDLALTPAAAAPASDDVLVATRAGTIVRLAAEDGREVWAASLGADTRGALTTVGNTVVVTDERGRVSGLDARTGELRWRSDAGMSAALGASPADSEPLLAYLATEDGDILALDARTGETRWQGVATGLVRAVVPAKDGVTVVTDEETVRFGAADGAESWTAPGASTATAAGTDALLTLRGRTVALYTADGELEGDWALPDSEDPADPRLLATDDRAVVVGPAFELWRVTLR
jgi:outer membrane protein assembly factor BamB